jgi:hypothetical protein
MQAAEQQAHTADDDMEMTGDTSTTKNKVSA